MDDNRLLDTLEQQGFRLATINKRAVAYAIDEIIISILFSFIVWGELKTIANPQDMARYTQSLFFYIFGVKVLYQTIFVHVYGATLGKIAMKIRVIDNKYFSNPTWIESFLRAIVRMFSEIALYFGFIVAYFSPLKLTWQDKVASTLVVDAE